MAKSTRSAGASKERKLLEKAMGVACYAGDAAAVRRLLEQDPELAKGWSPIMNSCYVAAAEVVKLLLENGADPNALAKTSARYRPLHRLAEHKKTAPRHEGHVRCAELLLKAGADPTLRAGWLKLTPLAMAANDGHWDLIQTLLAAQKGPLDVFHAAMLGDEKRVEGLLRKDPEGARVRDVNDMTALMYCGASRLGHADKLTGRNLASIASRLLAAGADPNAGVKAGSHGMTVVSFAVPNPAVLRLVLQAGGEPGPALTNALWERDFETAELLVEYGADVRSPPIAGYVGGFAHWGSFEQSRWLIEHGAPVDATDKYNTTALQSAARRGASPDFVQFLLEHGADPLQPTEEGDTPLELARKRKKTRLIPLLEKAAAHAELHKPGRDTTEDDEFEAGLPEHMRSKKGQGRSR